MKLSLGILFFILMHIPAQGEEPYPTLYRGEVTDGGPRLLAHFQDSFLRLEPSEQIAHLKKIEKELEKHRFDNMIYPGLVEKEQAKALYSIITDRLDQIYYVVSGIKLYPIQAKAFHFIQETTECYRKLSVTIETDWVTSGPPEITDPPPLLDLNRDPDGPLIFSGWSFSPIDELHQIKYQPIRFPKDLPEGLEGLFNENTDSPKTGRPTLFFSAPRTGFLPLEITLWADLLPQDTALNFFYEKKNVWNNIRFPFDRRQTVRYFVRPISRFDLNRNGKMEYLVEVEEDPPNFRILDKTDKIHRLIYEVDEESAEAFLMTSTTSDYALVQSAQGKRKGNRCRD